MAKPFRQEGMLDFFLMFRTAAIAAAKLKFNLAPELESQQNNTLEQDIIISDA